jgi:hypothetical protein
MKSYENNNLDYFNCEDQNFRSLLTGFLLDQSRRNLFAQISRSYIANSKDQIKFRYVSLIAVFEPGKAHVAITADSLPVAELRKESLKNASVFKPL